MNPSEGKVAGGWPLLYERKLRKKKKRSRNEIKEISK
jgi:hypothetical protein